MSRWLTAEYEVALFETFASQFMFQLFEQRVKPAEVAMGVANAYLCRQPSARDRELKASLCTKVSFDESFKAMVYGIKCNRNRSRLSRKSYV
jgi:hypothetical protein